MVARPGVSLSMPSRVTVAPGSGASGISTRAPQPGQCIESATPGNYPPNGGEPVHPGRSGAGRRLTPVSEPPASAPTTDALAPIPAGTPLGPLVLRISRAANERYWSSAGVDHPALRAGALYPPIAANLTVLLVQTVADRALLQTAQTITAHRTAEADVELTVTGTVTERFEKRGREYAVVRAEIALPGGDRLWTSIATFCAAGS